MKRFEMVHMQGAASLMVAFAIAVGMQVPFVLLVSGMWTPPHDVGVNGPWWAWTVIRYTYWAGLPATMIPASLWSLMPRGLLIWVFVPFNVTTWAAAMWVVTWVLPEGWRRSKAAHAAA